VDEWDEWEDEWRTSRATTTTRGTTRGIVEAAEAVEAVAGCGNNVGSLFAGCIF
jgi:hypothetical protein